MFRPTALRLNRRLNVFISGLQRSWVALMITAGGLQLFTIIVLILGLWPGDCKAVKRSSLYLVAAVMSLLGGRLYVHS